MMHTHVNTKFSESYTMYDSINLIMYKVFKYTYIHKNNAFLNRCILCSDQVIEILGKLVSNLEI